MIQIKRVEMLAKIIHETNSDDYDVPWENTRSKYRRHVMSWVQDVMSAEHVLAKRVAEQDAQRQDEGE